MSDLTDSTYFKKEINIPDSDYSDLDAYITRYEKEILQRLLGYSLWKLVNASPTSPTRIKELVSGKEYTISSGDTIKWNGFQNSDKISLIAYYVYYWWVRNRTTTLQTTGVMKLQSENSIAGSTAMKISAAWERLEELYGYPGQSENVASCYNFLKAHESDYSEWVFRPIGNVNAFDL